MNLILIWFLAYVLPFAAAFVVVKISPRRWTGSLSSNIIIVHVALLISILASQEVIHSFGRSFPLVFLPWGLLYAVAALLAVALLGIFGLWYALSALLQQLTMLSISFVLFPALPLYVVVLLVVPVYAVAHFMRVRYDSAKALLFVAWGAASVCIFYFLPSIWPLAALHTLFGALLIKQAVLYPEAGLSRAEGVEGLIDKDKYQVFLLVCPATLPFSFAVHPWFALNRKGIISWYGIGWRKARTGDEVFWEHSCKECRGHLHVDTKHIGEGIAMFPFVSWPLWPGRVLGFIEGGEGSLASEMLECVEQSIVAYPYTQTYRLRGPNSNTYVQWVLDQFPESGLRLPWNAFGKNYLHENPLA
jgi:hypothetical protein